MELNGIAHLLQLTINDLQRAMPSGYANDPG